MDEKHRYKSLSEIAKRICEAAGRYHVGQDNCEHCNHVYEKVKSILSEYDKEQIERVALVAKRLTAERDRFKEQH